MPGVNLFTEQKLTHRLRKQALGYQWEWGGQIRSLGSTYRQYYICGLVFINWGKFSAITISVTLVLISGIPFDPFLVSISAYITHLLSRVGFPDSSDSKESACNAGDPGSIPGSGISPGEGNGNPLQYSCLEDSMDRGAWKATLVSWGHRKVKHNWATNIANKRERKKLSLWPVGFYQRLFAA